MFPSSVSSISHLVTRVLFRFALPVLALLTVAALCVQGQGVTPSAVSTLLLPPSGCAAPCFLGITPGQTTLTAGLEQLRSSPLIQSVSPVSGTPASPAPSGLYTVEFTLAAAPLQTAQMQLVTEARTGIIDRILLTNSGISLNDTTKALGLPATFALDNRLNTGLATYSAFYPQYQVFTQMTLPLCSNLSAFQQNVVVGIMSAPNYAEYRSLYPPVSDPNQVDWQQQFLDLESGYCG